VVVTNCALRCDETPAALLFPVLKRQYGRVCGVEPNNWVQLRTPDVLLAELAARQHGVVARVQLVALGFDRQALAYRLKVGRLHLLHRGVYAVGHRPPSPLATAMAAVLACGRDAALSHGSAGALWRIVPRWPSPTHVTAPSERDRPGIHVHRSANVETSTHYGIRVTTPLRTLVDLADVLNPKQLTRALNEAQVQRLVTPAELTTLLTRYPGRRTARLTPERGATKSYLEDDFTRFLKHHRLPLPDRNQTIAGHEVDAVYRAQNLVIELDSRQFHTTTSAFEQDRNRDADLLNAGFSTLRITDERLKRHATHEARRLKEILRI
jgi:very-short-patch-repair endonuclease